MFVSLAEASEVALNAFTEGAPSAQQGTVASDGSREVKSNQKPKKKAIRVYSVVQEEGGPAFYVFNYKEGGWSIIAADRRLMPVLAYGETGTFEGEAMTAGLLKWQESLKTITHDVRSTKLESSKAARQTWKRLKKNSAGDVTTNRLPTEDPGPVDYTYTVGPLLTTTWDQGAGYNYYCPTMSGEKMARLTLVASPQP
ncbi:Spi family protease inhibitor [uncultured Hymenobacter sp.]|uniref:Spi family protease inhibitor n=1 Tax=uncultured Hymenobacter sp. TaxID=170016 RepID=UPI0035C9DE66